MANNHTLDPAMERWRTAYHEAGHAVVGLLHCAFKIGGKGVYLQTVENGTAGYCDTIPAGTLEPPHVERLWFMFAGRASHERFLALHGLVDAHTGEQSALSWLAYHRAGPGACAVSVSTAQPDDRRIIAALLAEHPDATDINIMRLYRCCAQAVALMVADTETWPAIERVAAALYARGHLSAADIAELVGSVSEAA